MAFKRSALHTDTAYGGFRGDLPRQRWRSRFLASQGERRRPSSNWPSSASPVWWSCDGSAMPTDSVADVALGIGPPALSPGRAGGASGSADCGT
jgi:hypothetical protein